jgi:hypothetical protein
MSYIDVPAKVLECFVESQTGEGAWPFNDGTNDPFWLFGTNPRDYRWRLTIRVKPQTHSSHKTRRPRIYNGMDVKVGDYVASTVDGTALRITRIDSKSDDNVVCLVEDIFRYNTFRDVSGLGSGLFAVPGEAMIFEVNEHGLPVVDPLPPSGTGSAFYANLMSRFQNLEKVSNFILRKTDHGFKLGQLVSADGVNNTFVLTDDDNPYLIGTVTFVNGPHHFTINPIQKIVDSIDALPGNVGDILYADPNIAGSLTTVAGTNPVMIKLRNYTSTSVRSTIANATSLAGNILTINGVDVTIPAGGSLAGLSTQINLLNAQHGITASVIPAMTIAQTQLANLNTQYGEVLLKKPSSGSPASATINGVLVEFTTSRYGQYRYQDTTLMTAEDMAEDITRAAIPNLVAEVSGTSLVLRQILGQGITIVNGTNDFNGRSFAGPASASGIPLLSTAPSGSFIRLLAPDARAINLVNKIGNPLNDYGLLSVENGIKAAAIYIEQGIRKASNYVVPDLAGRDALPSILGDQAYVIDKGDGQWGLYLYTPGNTWKVISTEEAAKVDSDCYSVLVQSHSPTTITLGRMNGGSKVTSVTFKVETAFDGNPTVSVGDDNDTARLATNEDFDIHSVGTYVVNPTHVYEGDDDVIVKVFYSANGANIGRLTVLVTYQ